MGMFERTPSCEVPDSRTMAAGKLVAAIINFIPGSKAMACKSLLSPESDDASMRYLMRMWCSQEAGRDEQHLQRIHHLSQESSCSSVVHLPKVVDE